MLGLLIGAAAGWLALLGLLLAAPGHPVPTLSPGHAPPPFAPRAPSATSTATPAVASLLARRLKRDGYPATLLDLAARGWLRLGTAPIGPNGAKGPNGPVTCALGRPADPRDQLTAYERQSLAQVELRAAGHREVPAAALGEGFAGPATTRPAGSPPDPETLKSGSDSFAGAFRQAVIADARRAGLSRPWLTGRQAILLAVAAVVPIVAAGLVLPSMRFLGPLAMFVVLCAVIGWIKGAERATPAGRAALREWRRRYPADRPVSFTPDRAVAYAAALGRAPRAVALFPRAGAGTVWSGYGGRWRQLTVGEPLPRAWPDGGRVWFYLAFAFPVFAFLAVVGTLAVHGAGGHLMQLAALATVAVGVVLLLRAAARDSLRPGWAEFDGLVVEAWVKVVKGEDEEIFQCLAIDDGVRDQAWAFTVTELQYAQFRPGTAVHVTASPRRNQLLTITGR